ncbi:splicing factor 3B subunit 2-like [Triticum urartu]|nr:splicing factor 3B subunit 2-like [Triticum urartu]XP_048549364.1 splicing factor 3B subunit 2-like [Triticum urartu]
MVQEDDESDMMLMCELMDEEDPVLQVSAKEIVELREEKVRSQDYGSETRVDVTDAGDDSETCVDATDTYITLSDKDKTAYVTPEVHEAQYAGARLDASPLEHAMYKRGEGRDRLLVGIYVDDMLITGADEEVGPRGRLPLEVVDGYGQEPAATEAELIGIGGDDMVRVGGGPAQIVWALTAQQTDPEPLWLTLLDPGALWPFHLPSPSPTAMAADPSSDLANGAPAPAPAPAAAGADKKKSRESERRRRRRKQKKSKAPASDAAATDADAAADAEEDKPDSKPPVEIEVEYVPEEPDLADGLLADFKSIFDKFTFKEPVAAEDGEKKDEAADAAKKGSGSDSDDDEQETQQKKKEGGISNKKKKLEQRMKIAELKQICNRPDVVEVWDATASDPKLLVYLKSYRNTVPVPRHWSQKRKFLQGKRGIEKQPFQLPDFIAATGIEKIRQAYIEKEDSKKLKQKQRERMQPKMGKMDIDYQVLHDAFFKYQTKPKLTSHGDLYYEGKEFEVKLREMKPGMLSRELKEALGMPEGAPPPWLINMQRYGPPPSYPSLKIPGLNAPIPPGATFGYRPGEWGKPPVDEHGRPLYGDVFGILQLDEPNYDEEPVDRSKHWGDLEEEEEEEEEDEEEEEEELMEDEDMEAGMQSVDTMSSTPTGVETPDVIDLRKQQRKESERPTDKQLYQVLEQKEEKIAPGTLYGSSHTYVVGAQDKAGVKRVDLLKNQKSDKVDVTIHPEELEVMDDVLAAKYEEAREEEKLRNQKEDFSDMVAENASKRKRKHEKDGKSSKKKDFKF